MTQTQRGTRNREAVIGILGGMGPEATARLFQLLTAATPAEHDQDHLHVLINSDPKIPDRTAAILGSGEDPLPALVEGARLLERAGADFLIMPCNTAHHWLPALREEVRVPILDMLRETVLVVARHAPQVSRIGLLATTGTVRTGLYESRLASEGVAVVRPTDAEQEAVMSVIHAVKAGRAGLGPRLDEVGQALRRRGAQGLLLGCTELSVVDLPGSSDFPVFDPLRVLAERAVLLAKDWDGPAARLVRREATGSDTG